MAQIEIETRRAAGNPLERRETPSQAEAMEENAFLPNGRTANPAVSKSPFPSHKQVKEALGLQACGYPGLELLRRRAICIESESNDENSAGILSSANEDFSRQAASLREEARVENLFWILSSFGVTSEAEARRPFKDGAHESEFHNKAEKFLSALQEAGVPVNALEFHSAEKAYVEKYGYNGQLLGEGRSLMEFISEHAGAVLSTESTLALIDSRLSPFLGRLEEFRKQSSGIGKLMEKYNELQEIRSKGGDTPEISEEIKKVREQARAKVSSLAEFYSIQGSHGVENQAFPKEAEEVRNIFKYLAQFILLNSESPKVKEYVQKNNLLERLFSLHAELYSATISATIMDAPDMQSGGRYVFNLCIPATAIIFSYPEECAGFFEKRKMGEFAAERYEQLNLGRAQVNALNTNGAQPPHDHPFWKIIHSNHKTELLNYGGGESAFAYLLVAGSQVPSKSGQIMEELNESGALRGLMLRISKKVATDDMASSGKSHSMEILEGLCWAYGGRLIPFLKEIGISQSLTDGERRQMEKDGLIPKYEESSFPSGNGLSFLSQNVFQANVNLWVKRSWLEPHIFWSFHSLFSSATQKEKEELFSAMKQADFSGSYKTAIEDENKLSRFSQKELNMAGEILRQYQLWESKQR